jgi:hypothetical protein
VQVYASESELISQWALVARFDGEIKPAGVVLEVPGRTLRIWRENSYGWVYVWGVP